MKTKFAIALLLLVAIKSFSQRLIEPVDGYTPQIGTLVSMLNDMKERVESDVKDLDINSTDFLLDKDANSIGTLVYHLAATEKLYHLLTFEGRNFNDEEKEIWGIPMSMGDEAREQLKGKPIDYYLEIYPDIREKTLEYLKDKDDAWLYEMPKGLQMNNYWAWYHVMEHQSSHLGQIKLIMKRLPIK